MSMIIPSGEHLCTLPSRQQKMGTLGQCPNCLKWWVWDWPANDFPGSWSYPGWQPVRWYHFNLQRRIKKASRG